MAEDTQTIDDSSDSGSDSSVNLNFDQLMKLIKETSAAGSPSQVYQPVNAAPQARPLQSAPAQQRPMVPSPQAPVPANVPQPGKVLDVASGAYVRPETAERVAWTRQIGNQLQQQDQQSAQQQQSQANQPKNAWQQVYEALRKQNPQATPQQLLSSMKAYKEAGAFEAYAKSAIGKTPEDQLYTSLQQTINPDTGKNYTPMEAMDYVRSKRGVSPEQKQLGSTATATGKDIEAARLGAQQTVAKIPGIMQTINDMIKVSDKLGADSGNSAAAISAKIASGKLLGNFQNVAEQQGFLEGSGAIDLLESIRPFMQGTGQVRAAELNQLEESFKYNTSQTPAQNSARFRAAQQQLKKLVESSIKTAKMVQQGQIPEMPSDEEMGLNLSAAPMSQQPSSDNSDPLGLFK